MGRYLSNYKDQWLTLKGPQKAGYTYDAHENRMLKQIKRAKKAVSHNQSINESMNLLSLLLLFFSFFSHLTNSSPLCQCFCFCRTKSLSLSLNSFEPKGPTPRARDRLQHISENFLSHYTKLLLLLLLLLFVSSDSVLVFPTI